MAKDPADRYQSAAEMRTDIQRALSGDAGRRADRSDGDVRAGTRAMAPAHDGRAGPTGAIPAYRYGPEDQPPRRRGPPPRLAVGDHRAGRRPCPGRRFLRVQLRVQPWRLDLGAQRGRQNRDQGRESDRGGQAAGRPRDQASRRDGQGRPRHQGQPGGTARWCRPTARSPCTCPPARPRRQVPSVVGKSEQDAEQALSQAGFNVGKITTDSNSTEPQGTVIQPVAGRRQPGQAGHHGRPDRVRRRGPGAQRGRRVRSPTAIQHAQARPA